MAGRDGIPGRLSNTDPDRRGEVVSMTDAPAARRESSGWWATFRRTRFDHSAVRAASWPVVVAVVVAAVLLTTAFQANRTLVLDLLRPIVEPTGRGLHPTLLVYVPFLAVVVWGLIFRAGRLRPRDVGLVRSHVTLGAGVTAATWLLMQATGVVVLLLEGRPVVVHGYWTTVGALAILGGLVGQLLGNALFEEVVYRGFLMVQLAKAFERRLSGRAARWAFALALLVSQSVFALVHVPGRLAEGVPPGALLGAVAVPFLFGVLFVLVYYRTGNLFVAIGLHALVNTPVTLVDAGPVLLVPLLGVFLGILLLWPVLISRLDRRRRGVAVDA
jgi:hypothetical protein